MDSDTINVTAGAQTARVEVNICTINICGMSERSRFCLDQYSTVHKLDILAVQESGTRNKELLNICNMDYMLDNNDSNNKGCTLYVNKKHSYRQIKVAPVSSQFDYIWSLIVMHGKRYIVGTAYVKSDNPQLIKSMVNMVNNVCDIETKKHKAMGVILMGDFNARHFAWKDKQINKNGEELMKQLDERKFTIHAPNSPSFLCINGDSVIDFFITSNNLSDNMSKCKTDNAAVLYSGAPIRGHVPIHIMLKIKGVGNKTTVRERIDLDKIDWEKWNCDLEDAIHTMNNQGLLLIDNAEEYWETLINMIDKVTKKNAGTKKTCTHSKPYWTQELSRLSKQYRKAQKCWNKRNTDANHIQLQKAKEEFDEKRKDECRKFIMKNTKDMNTSQTREFWKNFNKLFGKEKDSKVEILEDSEGNLVHDDEQKEKLMFQTFFEGQHLKKQNFNETFHDRLSDEYKEAKDSKFSDSRYEPLEGEQHNGTDNHHEFNKPIEESEVRYVLKYKKSTGKSFDEDGIHPRMLDYLGPLAIAALARLFNLCLDSGNWTWDIADVQFLKKEGKTTYSETGSYRPISITSYLGKVFEKIIVMRLESYLYGEGIVDAD